MGVRPYPLDGKHNTPQPCWKCGKYLAWGQLGALFTCSDHILLSKEIVGRTLPVLQETET